MPCEAQPSNQSEIPLSLYVHIPWCVKKCPYCDFNSHEKNQHFDEQAYVNALLLDLEKEFESCQQKTLHSIFFGGGTPSLFSADSIKQIIDHAQNLFKFNNIEITLEANPGTFEQEKFNAFHNAGINRLSIGIQSFNNTHLKQLGRIHDRKQALSAIETAHNSGFENINLDLMFGLPQQTVQQAIDDITTACEFNVAHISFYQLTIEENTYFHKHRPVLPQTDLIWEMQTQCQTLLAENNYKQYEISAYAKTDKQCSHNVNYWQFGDYIGIGAGAHGKITEKSKNTDELIITRHWKHRQPQQYIQKTRNNNATSGQQVLQQQDITFEFLLNALRLKAGSDPYTFKKHTGLDYQVLEHAVKNIDDSLLIYNNNKIATSEKGYLFLNNILESLI